MWSAAEGSQLLSNLQGRSDFCLCHILTNTHLERIGYSAVLFRNLANWFDHATSLHIDHLFNHAAKVGSVKRVVYNKVTVIRG